MPPIPGVVLNWHSLVARHAKHLKSVRRIAHEASSELTYHRSALNKAVKTIDAQIAGKNPAQLEPIFVRNTPRQPLHPLARIRQQQSRWYSNARSAIRSFSTSSSSHVRNEKTAFSKTRIGTHFHQAAGRAPFASTLRPNLTGGTLGRTAGGYTLGSGRVGGARYFSHGPASQAQVVHNVSQGMRAFFTAGHKAHFDGFSTRSGEKRFKTVSKLQDETSRTMKSVPRATPGSWIDFRVNPTITALTPLDATCVDISADAGHLNTEGLIDLLSVDFSRVLKDLAATLNDIRRLSSLGDLPITHQAHCIRVHFPGCDAESIESLCNELGIQRGIVVQDPAFDSFVGTEMALLFPYAPSEDTSDVQSLDFTPQPAAHVKSGQSINSEDMLSSSTRSEIDSHHSDYSTVSDIVAEDLLSSPRSRFESIRSESLLGSDKYSPLEYQGIEGIYRFIEQCDSARR